MEEEQNTFSRAFQEHRTPFHTQELQPEGAAVGACLQVCMLGAGHCEQAGVGAPLAEERGARLLRQR